MATVTVAILLSAGCTENPDTQGTAAETHFSYDEGAATADELVAKSDAVVFARPLAEAEKRLREDPSTGRRQYSIVVYGQPFQVLESMKGSLKAGDRITVIRTTVERSPGDSAAVVADDSQRPFTRPLYLLGLDSTNDTYGLPAWFTVGGPSGRVPFESQNGTDVVVPENEEDAVQRSLAGQDKDSVRRAVRPD